MVSKTQLAVRIIWTPRGSRKDPATLDVPRSWTEARPLRNGRGGIWHDCASPGRDPWVFPGTLGMHAIVFTSTDEAATTQAGLPALERLLRSMVHAGITRATVLT